MFYWIGLSRIEIFVDRRNRHHGVENDHYELEHDHYDLKTVIVCLEY